MGLLMLLEVHELPCHPPTGTSGETEATSCVPVCSYLKEVTQKKGLGELRARGPDVETPESPYGPLVLGCKGPHLRTRKGQWP